MQLTLDAPITPTAPTTPGVLPPKLTLDAPPTDINRQKDVQSGIDTSASAGMFNTSADTTDANNGAMQGLKIIPNIPSSIANATTLPIIKNLAQYPAEIQGLIKDSGGLGNAIKNLAAGSAETGLKSLVNIPVGMLEHIATQFGGKELMNGDIPGMLKTIERNVINDPFGMFLSYQGIKGSIAGGAEAVKTGDLGEGVTAGRKAINETPSLPDLPKLPGATDIINTVKDKANSIIEPIRSNLEQRQIEAIKGEVDDLFKSGRGIEGKVKLADQKNIPLRDIISDPNVFRGIKAEKATVNPDQAIETLQNRVDAMMDAKGKILHEVDRFAPDITKAEIRDRAIKDSNITSLLPADQKIEIANIDRQLDALPENLKPGEVDALRAKARTGARDSKGLQRPGNAYSALENATRDAVFNATNNMPFDTNHEFAKLNTDIKNNIGAIEFLDKTLRGQKTKGGRLGTYALRIGGQIVGSAAGGGVLGSIATGEVGATISRVLQDNQLGSNFKMSMIRGMTDDPAILKAADLFLKKAQQTTRPLLPAGTPGSGGIPVNNGMPIPVMPNKPGMEYVGPDVGIGEYKSGSEAPGTAYPPVAPEKPAVPQLEAQNPLRLPAESQSSFEARQIENARKNNPNFQSSSPSKLVLPPNKVYTINNIKNNGMSESIPLEERMSSKTAKKSVLPKKK